MALTALVNESDSNLPHLPMALRVFPQSIRVRPPIFFFYSILYL